MLQRLRTMFASPVDPTADWPQCQPVPLTLTLPEAAVNGIAIGDNYAGLRAFGRPNNPEPYQSNRFDYYPLGLIVEGQHETIEYFEFKIQEDDGDSEIWTCKVTLIDRGHDPITLSGDTNISVIEGMWGAPDKRHDFDDEIVDWYERGPWVMEFVWSKRGWLQHASIERWNKGE
jgi:hypothetical protein